MSSLLEFTKGEGGDKPQLGQFAQQSMSPHNDQLKMFAGLFAGETGLTLDDLGFVTDNPSSAEAIKASHENLELCFAIALPALGSAILFNIGSSSGGTDIIAMILKKYSSFDIGKALLISDALITASGFFIFDIETGLFSLLGLSIRSFMIDTFIESFNLSKYFNVVCDNPEPICDYIVHTLGRSASVCLAKGAYSGNDKYIILTALNRMQAVHLRNFIRENDKEAFILISNTSEIIGKGFHSV